MRCVLQSRLEVKRPRGWTDQAVDDAVMAALEQIEQKRYVQRLERAGELRA